MPHVKNTTDFELTIRHNGTAYVFPAGAIAEVDDDEAARAWKQIYALPPSPKEGRLQEVFPIDLVTPGKDDKVLTKIVLRHVEDIDPAILAAQAAYSLHGKPRENGGVPPPPTPEVQEMREKALIGKLDPDLLLREGRKRKLWKSGIEKRELVDALHKSGFRA